MLPFLDQKKITQVISSGSKGGESPPVESDGDAACKECANRLIEGVNSKSPEQVVSAIRDMVEILKAESGESTE